MPPAFLDPVLATCELETRPSRPPDHAGENGALRELMAAYGERPETVLARLVELVTERCNGDGAGLSVLERGPDGEERLRWVATAGAFAAFEGTVAPRAVSPGDAVIARGATQLFARPARQYPVMDAAGRRVHEELVTPFRQDGGIVGTLWVVSFDEARRFDAEDRRMLESLALFAATAWQRHVAQESRVERRTEELVSKHQELEGLTYAVSHDMRTPLRAMVANATLVLRDEGPRVSEEGREQLERLATAALKMAQLVDDLLRFARLGTREVASEPVDLSALAEAVWEEMESPTDASFRVEPGLVAHCDPTLMGMALQCLFENARKYRKPEGPLNVSFGIRKGTFAVQDDGIGFDMAYVRKIFEPFQRLHREEYPGTGIGLANARRVIERHGGRFWAESHPGDGATFFFVLG